MKIKKIKWNEVTWYSKLLAVVVFALTFYVGFFLGQENEKIYTDALVMETKAENFQVKKNASKDGNYCFSRKQVTPKTEPSNIEESISLNIKGDVVKGNKRVSQNGPDMINNYTGDLDGTLFDNTLYLFYSYTIEGSNNTELEVYQLKENSLVKMRWPLQEKYGMLIPNKSGDPDIINYSKVNCNLK